MRWVLVPSQSPTHRRGRDPRAEDGVVTAETAVVLPVLVALLALLLGVLGHALDHTQIVDAARSGARLAARGEPPAVVERAVLAEAPDGADVEVVVSGSTVTVQVSAPGRRLLGAITLPAAQAQAVAMIEGFERS